MEDEAGFKISENRFIGRDYPTYFIAEIGQNHQGDVEIAKKLILSAKNNGADCVKFQKSNLNEKFTAAALDRPYINSNSWGPTYRAHKEHLELSDEDFFELKYFAEELHQITFTASAMDLDSVDFLCDRLNVSFLKIGSGDSNNLPLIRKAAMKGVPLVISTGMVDMTTVEEIYDTVTKCHNQLILMHCVSSYPLNLDDVNLKVLELYQKRFPNIVVGYSGHEVDVDCCLAAVALGAKVIERHFTLDHNQIGSDHKCSLTPRNFRRMVNRIRKIEVALGKIEKKFLYCELNCSEKLGKSVVLADFKRKGQTLTEADLLIKVTEPKGVDGSKLSNLVGKKLKRDLNKDEPILFDDLD